MSAPTSAVRVVMVKDGLSKNSFASSGVRPIQATRFSFSSWIAEGSRPQTRLLTVATSPTRGSDGTTKRVAKWPAAS